MCVIGSSVNPDPYYVYVPDDVTFRETGAMIVCVSLCMWVLSRRMKDDLDGVCYVDR